MLEMMTLGSPAVSNVRVKKALDSNSSVSFLTESGKLYVRGTDARYQMGEGNKADYYDAWGLSMTEVVDYWGYLGGILYLKTDGSWWIVGSYSGFDINTTNAWTHTNVSSRFATLPVEEGIAKVVIGYGNTVILLNSGDVWITGSGQHGVLQTADTTPITTCVKIQTGGTTGIPADTKFKDIAMTYGSRTLYLVTRTVNDLYGLGNGNLGLLANGTTASVNYVARRLAANVARVEAGSNVVYVENLSRQILAMGSAKYGQTGTNYYSDDSVYATSFALLVTMATDYQWSVGLNRLWVRSTTAWRYWGFITYGIGTTNNLSQTTYGNVITPGMETMAGAVLTSRNPGSFASIAVLDGVLYGCGYNHATINNLPGITKGTTSKTFVPLLMTGVS